MEVDAHLERRASPFMRVQEACQLAQISRSTFYRALANPDSGLDEFVISLPGIQGLRIPKERFIEWPKNATVRRGRGLVESHG